MRNSDLNLHSQVEPARNGLLLSNVLAAATFASALLFVACGTTADLGLDNAAWEPDPADPSNTALPEGVPAAGTDPVSQDHEQMLREDARLLELKEQRRAFLVEQHMNAATGLRDRLRLRDAREELLAALTLDPDHLQAKKNLAEINALLGEGYDDKVSSVTETLQGAMNVRTQQLRAEADDLLRQGKLMLARGDYDGAIAQLTIAAQTVRFAPYSVDWNGIDNSIDALLNRAKSERANAEEASLLEAQRKAYEELQTRETEDSARRRQVIDNMLTQAIDAFNKGAYEDAIYYADQALRKDPRNQQAEELRESAFKAGLKQTRVEYVAAKREQFKRWKEDIESYKILWNDTITLPDPDEWAAMTERRSKRRGLDFDQMRTPSDLALRETLRKTLIKLPPVEEEDNIRAIIDMIRIMTGLPLVVDPAAFNAVIDEGILFTFSFENELTVEQALNLVTDFAGETVTWTVRHDAVMVTTVEKARGEPTSWVRASTRSACSKTSRTTTVAAPSATSVSRPS